MDGVLTARSPGNRLTVPTGNRHPVTNEARGESPRPGSRGGIVMDEQSSPLQSGVLTQVVPAGRSRSGSWSGRPGRWAGHRHSGSPSPVRPPFRRLPGSPARSASTSRRTRTGRARSSIENVWTAAPATSADVVTIANWAYANGWRVRPKGMGHGWSPLILPEGNSGADYLLVDTTQHLTNMSISKSGTPATVTAQTGVTMDTLLDSLSARSGLGLTANPAPGDLTLGGVLAIGGHGTAIKAQRRDRHLRQDLRLGEQPGPVADRRGVERDDRASTSCRRSAAATPGSSRCWSMWGGRSSPMSPCRSAPTSICSA